MKIGKLVFEKIKHQFPKTPEGRLLRAVIEQALKDTYATKALKLTDKKGKHYTEVVDDVLTQMDAWAYLNGPIEHARMAGVSPTWIKSVIHKIQRAPECLIYY